MIPGSRGQQKKRSAAPVFCAETLRFFALKTAAHTPDQEAFFHLPEADYLKIY